jgi:hypothetical protein
MRFADAEPWSRLTATAASMGSTLSSWLPGASGFDDRAPA